MHGHDRLGKVGNRRTMMEKNGKMKRKVQGKKGVNTAMWSMGVDVC